MMLSNYRAHFVEAGVTEERTSIGLLSLFDTGGSAHLPISEPDEPHPAGADAQRRKIETARPLLKAGPTSFQAPHAYGPVEDVLGRVRGALAAGRGQAWINRYGYLGRAKLERLGQRDTEEPASTT